MASSDNDDGLKKAADKLTDEKNYENLQKDLSAVKNDLAALAEQLSEALTSFTNAAGKQARRSYRDARSNVEGLASDLSDRGGAVADAAHDAANSVAETLENAVRERPLATVALAVGLGFLIGVTWRR
jgi:ElaB/YqjD/DUF883 family membrane-anchored ribosome-binding protein